MELTSPKNIKNLLKKYDLRPSKRLGQHFLVDRGVLEKIIRVADLKKSDTVLEIGPGIGTLTQELAKRVKKVIAVEKDRKMIEILREMLEGLPRTEPKVLVRGWNVGNVEIIESDILKTNIQNLISNIKYKVVTNLPYYIVSPVIRKFLELTEARPLEMILMVQKEVAQRICAKPPDMSILAVSVQFYAKPKILFYVPKESFWPQPKVDGAVLRISRICTNLPRIDTNLFFKIVRAGFSQPRKQLCNNLAKMLALSLPNEVKLDKPSQILRNKTWAGKEGVKKWLLKNKINPTQRAETLEIKDWLNLTRTC